MFSEYNFSVTERFLRYVQVDTQSDPKSETHPTTEKQKDLSRLLVNELHAIGASDVEMDAHGYVFASIPSNSAKQVPVICFCSHVDTAPDCSGTNVKPILHKGYDGRDIVLPNNPSQVLRLPEHPCLADHINHDIITASGNTLLGADDKAGVAIIMDMASYLIAHPEVPHGEIRILFTPDEEVGKGTAKLDMNKLNATYGYTLDGGPAGSLEDETFSADAVTITIDGVIAHPGYAKNKLVNAIKIAGEILEALPKEKLSPETTEGRQGFVHPVFVQGLADKATLEFIIRAFDDPGLEENSNTLRQIAEEVLSRHPRARMEFMVKEQYRNMKQVLDQHPQVVAYAEEAIGRAGLQVIKESIRGGTDGSKLSFMGLPSANIFTGMQAIHSRLEWVGVRDMEKAVETLVHLSMVWEEKSE